MDEQLLYIENELYDKYNFNYICGVDEAGRGPLAGPVCAAAVILPRNCIIDGLNDSKKLTSKKRDYLYDVIKEKSLSFSIAYASVEEIEQFNILEATFLAMNRAINGLDIKPDFALIDGNQSKGITIDNMTVVKGDSKCSNIAAASILAKVSRDRYMLEISKEYPQYYFEKHKGYGTKLHYECINKHGITAIHRKSFLKNMH